MEFLGRILKKWGRLLKNGPEINTTANIAYLLSSEKLKGKKIIITGGGKGIGLALANKFKKEGAEVLISGRDEQNLKEISSKIECHYKTLDVLDIDSFKVFIDNAERILNGIDCLVNNAGISLHEQTFLDVTPKTFDDQINTNLKGSFFLTQEFIKLLRLKKRNGNVLFISSETGNTADIRPYGLTKASINSLVRGLAYMYAEKGIRVNAIAPGVTASEMTGFKKEGNLYCNYTISKRVYLPEEMAEVATFLLSDISGCISGEIITCNNGNTINARWR